MMWNRLRKEERELRDLAPFASKAADSAGRKHPEEPDALRTIYERDRDRIIHSSAFRRLEYKTQVFVYHVGDAYRNRLTHTLETLQVARSLASALGLNEPLVEALSLAHDLGHPPFGHRGETVLANLMRDHGGFHHHLQSLRTVDLLERHSHHHRGLNLSYEVRDGLLKRPAERGGEFPLELRPTLEAQVVDLADSTAYNHHDVDDGLRAGIVSLADLEPLAIWRRACQHVEEHEPKVRGTLRIRRLSGALLRICIHDLIENSSARLQAMCPASAQDARLCEENLIANSAQIRSEIGELQDFLFANFYRHHRLNQMASRAARILGLLFESYRETPTSLPPSYQQWCEEVGVERAICDYIAGMTDRYAEQEYARFFLPGGTVPRQ